MCHYTDAENTGIPAVPIADTNRPTDNPRADHEEFVLSHRL
jgi:hypothetical protein